MNIYNTYPNFTKGDISIREYVNLILANEKVKKIFNDFHIYRKTVDLVIDSVQGLRDIDQFKIDDEKVLKTVLEDMEMVKKHALLRILDPMRKEIVNSPVSSHDPIEEKRFLASFVHFSISDVFSNYLIKEILPYFPKGTTGFVRKTDELVNVFCLFIWMTARHDQFSDYGQHNLSFHRKNLISKFAEHIRHDESGPIRLVFDDPLSWSSIKVDGKEIVVDESAIQLLSIIFRK